MSTNSRLLPTASVLTSPGLQQFGLAHALDTLAELAGTEEAQRVRHAAMR